MTKNDFLEGIDYLFDQEGCPYKLNSDTVALGKFLDPLMGKTVLDIGTNSGALLLYAHEKGAKFLYGTDIHEDALNKAKENLERYTGDFRLFHCPVQELAIDPVDTIICNPPFFEMNNVTEDPYMKQAMFEEGLPLGDLFSSFRRLMKENGEVFLIYQADRFPEIYDMCKAYKLKIMKMAFVHDVSSLHALRILLKLKIGKMSKLKVLKPVMLDKGKFKEW